MSGFLTTLRDFFLGPIEVSAETPAESRDLRRYWDAAKTTRLNQAHWNSANQDQRIAEAIGMYGETLRKRATFEASNNGLLAGMIETHKIDVVGAHGPTLQVISKNKTFNQAVEAGFAEWAAMPDIQGRVSLSEALRQSVHLDWTAGDTLIQKVNDRDADSPVKMRIRVIHPRRLQTPMNLAGEPNIVLGIEVSEVGKPTAYYIAVERHFGDSAWETGEFERIPASDMIHAFFCNDPEQPRGVPWIASTLQDIADLNDFEKQVHDAARAAADWSIVLEAGLGNEELMQFDGDTVSVERRTMRALPPGYTAKQLQGNQPGPQFLEYVKEKQAAIGRPVAMPLMVIRLDARDHNYSSARMDDQVYGRSICAIQAHKEAKILNPLAMAWIREAQLAGVIPQTVRGGFKLSWTWPKRPHVDPLKEALAERTRMENGTLTYGEALVQNEQDLETTIEKRKRENQMLKDAGLPPIPTYEPKAFTVNDSGEFEPIAQPAPAKQPAKIQAIGGSNG